MGISRSSVNECSMGGGQLSDLPFWMQWSQLSGRRTKVEPWCSCACFVQPIKRLAAENEECEIELYH